jgi:glutamyl-tRNA synthetase
MLPIRESTFDTLKIERDSLVQQLQFTQWRMEAVAPWQRDAIFAALKALADGMDIKVRDFLAPLFIAISGSQASISVIDAMEMLGSDLSRARIRHAIDVLGGVSRKKSKELEKTYTALH